jgi:phosphatidylglycerol:prolipoprotein diacylglycerol transferase
MINFWQHIPEHINPDIIRFGQFQIRYYGLMYVVAFTIVYLLVSYRIKSERLDFSKDVIQDFFVWLILGLMIGARIGYVIFYNFSYYLSNPIEIFLPFSFSGGFHFTGLAGMSYHGGLIGIIVASTIFCIKKKMDFWRLADLLIPAIPLGYTFGRIGNFINGELYGRVTSIAWGMFFPLDPDNQLRHPSQLYEAFFEGLFLFAILWSIRRKNVIKGFFLSAYLVGYGTVRFFIEFTREPDAQLGFIAAYLTMGQILCIIMIVAGLGIFYIRKKRRVL